MQIHELAALGRTPTTGDSLAIDTGSATVKIDYSALATAILDKIGAGSDGVVDISHGGTGAETAADARAALGAAASADLADAYSSSSTYDVGDLCIYHNALYVCTTAITTAEAWTAAHWEATTLNDVVLMHTDVVNSLTNTNPNKAAAAPTVKELADMIAARDIALKFNIDDFNYDAPPDRGIITYADSTSTGTKPDSITGSNSNVVISFVIYNYNDIIYGTQIAFGFSNNRVIAIRNHAYGTSNSWNTWKQIG